MKINVSKLVSAASEGLKPENQKKFVPTSGVFKAIEAALQWVMSSAVDWDSFTLSDAHKALEEAYYYDSVEGLDWAEGYDGYDGRNESNALHQYIHSLELFRDYRKSSPVKEATQFF